MERAVAARLGGPLELRVLGRPAIPEKSRDPLEATRRGGRRAAGGRAGRHRPCPRPRRRCGPPACDDRRHHDHRQHQSAHPGRWQGRVPARLARAGELRPSELSARPSAQAACGRPGGRLLPDHRAGQRRRLAPTPPPPGVLEVGGVYLLPTGKGFRDCCLRMADRLGFAVPAWSCCRPRPRASRRRGCATVPCCAPLGGC